MLLFARLPGSAYDRCPEETIRRTCGDDLGVQLAFVPEDYDGMGGGAFDSHRICERLARPRPGAGHIGVRDLPRQRPDRLRRYG
ncbi:acyl-CoA dehydrogenase family protein [Nonomuraea harbinensis]|uniref:Acyl-CoA dehydrogenase family protein n=1 Tax=Nonomuraea harbinensis TaxID=1286938 RepID=A0ABW1CAD3_9ACTN|nr:acyl-CoA dehydrogenase family protein [Nonomuraea harbinensis]